jgi:hypothetical protein
MIVAFLDLLGFSELVKTDTKVALDNMNSFNRVIETRFIDNKFHPMSEYEEQCPNYTNFHNFVEKSSITAFEQMISISDSLILGGTNCDLFIMQLANFVATVYIRYSEPFKKPFTDISKVLTDKVADVLPCGSIRNHNAFPLLFRGGISVGKNIVFFDQNHIKSGKLQRSSLNVMGLTYLNAVKLESFGKGPHLFCDKSVVDVVNEKTRRILREIDKDKGIYEIVWTIEGPAGKEYIDKWKNVTDRINDTMLPSAINLYHYYRKNEHLEVQYKELLKLVCQGIVKYAADECNCAEDAIRLINQKLPDRLLINKSILDNFIPESKLQ